MEFEENALTKDKKSRQIIFDGEALTMEAVWRRRDAFFPLSARLP